MPNTSPPKYIPDTHVLNALYEHIAVLDLTGHIIFVNQAWKNFGDNNNYQDPNYGLGQHYLSTVSDPKVTKGIQAVLNGTMSQYAYEYPCDSPTEKRWFWLYVTPVIDHQNQIIGAATSHINITKRKQAEQEVKNLQQQLLQDERTRVLIETAGAAAHEINQPLTVILGLSDLLSKRTDLPSGIQEDLQFILESSARISQIIKKMQEIETYASKAYVGKNRIVDFEASNRSKT